MPSIENRIRSDLNNSTAHCGSSNQGIPMHVPGVWRLATIRRSFSGESSPDPGATAGGIEVRAIKTTPTCLSCYLG